jgi:hypothetical protein
VNSFAPDLPKRDTLAIAATQRPLTLSADLELSGVPAWKTIPSWYFLGTEDLIIPEAQQRFMAAVPELARTLRPGGRIYIYDFPFAPFDQLADTARTRSVLNAHPPEQTPIRTGVPFLRCVRYVMSP